MTPFFVLGNPRSGTSLFRLMLNSHPEITVPPECGFALWLAEKYKSCVFNDLTYDNYAHDVTSSKKFETWNLSKASILNMIVRVRPQTYSEMAGLVYFAYAKERHKEPLFVGDKNNYYIKHMDDINVHFPSSKKVFIIRDGRDVVCSYLELSRKKIDSKYKPVLPTAISNIAMEWSASAQSIKDEINHGSIFIKYESLLLNPEKELVKICDYLGVLFSVDMLDYQSNNDEPKDFLQWKGNTEKELLKDKIGRYKKILSKQECNTFAEIAKDYLGYFNYEIE